MDIDIYRYITILILRYTKDSFLSSRSSEVVIFLALYSSELGHQYWNIVMIIVMKWKCKWRKCISLPPNHSSFNPKPDKRNKTTSILGNCILRASL